jgi:hypothetical protein
VILDGPERAAARAYLKGIGYDDDDLNRPIIGIANTWTETMPCNFHLRRLAERVKDGIRAAGGTPMEFNTIAISDGITMGTQGMKTSLISREVIADSIELVARGHMFDGVIAMSGCDKTIPGCVMALARLDVPGLMLYGGTIMPGHYRGKDVTIQDVFEAVGAHAAGDITDDDLLELEGVASPGAGACGGQYTANTMATAFEVLGISPMGSGMVPAEDGKKGQVAEDCGRRVVELVSEDLKPSTVITRQSLENAIAGVAATGGSTNAVLHLLAVANEAGIELSIDDFDEISKRTPLIADLKPGGRFVALDMYRAGGMRLVVKRLLDAGLLHGDVPTVTGKTLAEEAGSAEEADGQEVIRPLDNPLQPTGGLGRDPQRGSGGRSGDARDAARHRGAGRRGAGGGGRAAHGRALLRRHPWLDGRTRRAGGAPRRTDRGRARRRHHRVRRGRSRAAARALRRRDPRAGGELPVAAPAVPRGSAGEVRAPGGLGVRGRDHGLSRGGGPWDAGVDRLPPPPVRRSPRPRRPRGRAARRGTPSGSR